MEVVCSLSNVLQVFPLRSIGRNDILAHEQVDCPVEAEAANVDVMEEGEIDARVEAHAISNEQQFIHGKEPGCRANLFFLKALQSASAPSAESRSPPLSVMTNTLQHERSGDPPSKLSSRGLIRVCNEDPSLECEVISKKEFLAFFSVKKQQGFSPINQAFKQAPAACPSKNLQGGSPLKQAQDAALLSGSSLVQQYSSQPKIDGLRPNYFAAVEQLPAEVPPQASSDFCSPIKSTGTFFDTKKLQVSPNQPCSKAEAICQGRDSVPQSKKPTVIAEALPLSSMSPQLKHPRFTPTSEAFPSKLSIPQAEKPCDASLGSMKFLSPSQFSPLADSNSGTSLSLPAKKPQAAFLVDNRLCAGTYEVSSSDSIASKEHINCAKVRHSLLTSSTLALAGIPHVPDEDLSLLELPHQPTQLSQNICNVSEKKCPCDLGMKEVHCPMSYGKAYITCVNGKTRIRSSATRDYPEGCGKNVPLKGVKATAEPLITSILRDKVVLKTHPVKEHVSAVDHVLNTSVKQVGIESSNLADCQEAYTCGQGIIKDKEGPLYLSKEPKASASFIKRQKVQGSLKRKQGARSPDTLLQMANKKIRYISWRLDSANEDPCLSASSEQGLQTAWVKGDYLEHVATSERSKKSKGEISYMEQISRVTFAKQVPKPSGDLDHPLSITACSEASARASVKKTLQEFDFVRRSLAASRDGRHHRPDLAAASILKTKGRWRNCGDEKIVGSVPGVEVGDQFSFRIEMLIIGLHRQCQGGIDYIAGSRRLGGPLATSIVASGGYEDDDDCGETFIYTGQGGNMYKGDRRQACDQVLARGNLALSNSCKERSPVRVIRGSTDEKFYSYDGLYDVVDCWFQTGVAGFGVYQFKLSRRLGQPELAYSIVRFMGSVKKKGLARPHLVMGDISHGKEMLPICVVNEVDEELAPQYFTYVPKMKYADWYFPDLPEGCNCVGGCVDASKCLCAARNGGEFPYNEFGQIVTDHKVVFECGKSCACSSLCHNRVSQRGPRHQLEVFKTLSRGWGVRSLEPIRPASLICEYVGELLSDSEAEQRVDCDEYLFDIGNQINAWNNVSELMDKTMEGAIVPVVEDAGYTIDARLYGNVARFINHSCSPNLFAQNVVYDTDDLRFPHVILFSAENIPPMRELSYDYNYTIGHVNDRNGDVKSKPCYCGVKYCRGRLY